MNTNTTNTGHTNMNAPTTSASSVAKVAAAMAARTRNPGKLIIDPKTPGLAAVLVMFKPPSKRFTPSHITTTFDDALQRASDFLRPAIGATLTPDEYKAAQAAHIDASSRFIGTLPDVISPVAALGIAVREAVTKTSEWVHNGTRQGHSKWTYCDSHIAREGGARILGDDDQCAECSPDGTLTIDPNVPADIRAKLRDAYEVARGVVEPSRIKTLVSSYLARCGGRSITDDLYLLPDTSTATVGVLAGLIDLGGWANTTGVTDPERVADLAGPVTESLEGQIAKVIADTKAFIARCKAAQDPTSTDMMTASDGTVADRLDNTLAAASLWRDKLQLASLDIDDEVQALKNEAKQAAEAAKLVVDARRAAKKAAKEAAKEANPEALKAIDEEQAREERAEQAKVTQ